LSINFYKIIRKTKLLSLYRVYPIFTLRWIEINGIFFWRGWKIEMPSERAFLEP
jgi:hypothetical protein